MFSKSGAETQRSRVFRSDFQERRLSFAPGIRHTCPLRALAPAGQLEAPMFIEMKSSPSPLARRWTSSVSTVGIAAGMFAALSVIGCADGAEPEPAPVVSVFEPVNPTGTVTGQVVNALNGAPIEGATVRLPAEDVETSTDASGGFRFDAVPASAQIALRYSADGYADAIDTVTIPSSAGTLAQDNGVAFSGPVGLLPTTAGEAGAKPRVVVRQEGSAVTDAILEARLDVGYFIAGAPFGQMTATATVDGDAYIIDGIADLRSLAVAVPTARLRIAVSSAAPADFRPTVIDRTVGEILAEGTVVVDLAPTEEPPPPEPDPEPGFAEDDPLEVVDSSLIELIDAGALLPTVAALADGHTLTFNRPVLAGTLYVDAITSDGDAVAVTASTSDDLTYTLAFGGSLPGGTEVSIVIDALADAPAGIAVAPFRAEATFFVSGPPAVNIVRAYYANNGDLDEVDCPDNLQNRSLIIDLNAPIGARVLNIGGVAVAANLNQMIAIGIFSEGSGAFDLFNGPTQEPVLARLIETTNSGSGFRTRLQIPGTAFVNTPPPVGNTPDSESLILRFNDLTIADALGQNGDVVIRRTNGQPMSEVAGAVDILRANCN